uniref:N-acetylgalactosaminide beta-1,3-galactosyltransferase n=1 Tax=Heterorhabditis bacteriophora TaxID=37862 RepID=A0A1I7X7J0_HETBA
MSELVSSSITVSCLKCKIHHTHLILMLYNNLFQALAVNETWLPRCDHGQFFTGDFFTDNRVPYSTVFAGIPESYYNLFYKSRYAFHYIYEHISKEFDWYLKADDDTYVVVEHLRKYLSFLDPNKPYYLGYTLKPYLVSSFNQFYIWHFYKNENGYNAGGAGYVLSRAALKIFNEKLYINATLCPDDIYEDVGIGRCLASVGIFPHDTRNALGQNRFNTHTPSDIFHSRMNNPKYTYFVEHKVRFAIYNLIVLLLFCFIFYTFNHFYF